MTSAHPSELELLALVEGELELEPEAAARLRRHLASCAECARAVAGLETARAALRQAPLLELPPRRREEILAGLPARPRLVVTPRRLLLAAAPLAASAVVAVVILWLTSGGPGPVRPPVTAAVERAQSPSAGALRQGPTRTRIPPLRLVAGPPASVVAMLRARGFEARVVLGRAVEVENAAPQNVARALAGRPAGDVPVYVVTRSRR